MIVLGIIDSKPSSAAILKDGQILSAIAILAFHAYWLHRSLKIGVCAVIGYFIGVLPGAGATIASMAGGRG